MTYHVLTNLKHNGQRYNAGDRVEIDDADAQPLVDAGVLSTGPVEAENAAPEDDPKAGGPADGGDGSEGTVGPDIETDDTTSQGEDDGTK